MNAEKKLKEIAKIFDTTTGKVSTHAYYNLEGAIIDLERTGKSDKIILSTLKRVAGQLAMIGRILDKLPK